MTALLLAEPEPAVRGFLERQLRNDGFDVVSCERAEQLPRAADPDVLLLGDAEALDRGVVPDCPVIVLGGADSAARVRALARADDCLPRPFVYEELLARIHALLRRCPPRAELTEVGPLAIDRSARRVTVLGREVELSAKEYALLVKLAADPDRVFTREQLLRDVWGFRTYVPTRTLESHASRVRRKLAAAGLPGWVVNVWGVGRRLAVDVGEWREVASLHGFRAVDRLTIRPRSGPFGHGLGTHWVPSAPGWIVLA
jgi:DNA-binding response OmpR family regulator